MIRELDPVNTVLTETSNKKYLWDGVEIAEERSSDGGTVLRRFYSQGYVDTDGTILYYTRDHLGSIRELTDSSQAIRARYDYDPYGRMTKISGDRDSFLGFTGHVWHGQSGLNLAFFRAYDPNLGRWISRDRLEEEEDLNLYGYVFNNAINLIDQNGLQAAAPAIPWAAPWVIPVICNPAGLGIAILLLQTSDASPSRRCPPCDRGPRNPKCICEGPAKYEIIGQNKNVVPGETYIVAGGMDEAEARYNWIKEAQSLAPRGQTARHIFPKRCYKIR
ncbi:MAG: hypothetical protein HY823_10205 [Acidobacteria bacterium]|nr:hypothetical protein [Acidobacteriota bacterium]